MQEKERPLTKLGSLISLPNTQTFNEDLCRCGNALYAHVEVKSKTCESCLKKERLQHVKENISVELSMIGVPKRYLECSFDNFNTKNDPGLNRIVSVARSINRNSTESLFFSSTRSGTGKTHLSVAIARELLLNDLEGVRFISSPFLFLEIKATFGSNDPKNTEKIIIEKYSSIPFLIVDDIGVEKISEWANQIWYMIVDSRHVKMLPTVYTSNLNIGEIAVKIDTRVASRLSSGLVFDINTSDYRIKNRVGNNFAE